MNIKCQLLLLFSFIACASCARQSVQQTKSCNVSLIRAVCEGHTAVASFNITVSAEGRVVDVQSRDPSGDVIVRKMAACLLANPGQVHDRIPSGAGVYEFVVMVHNDGCRPIPTHR